MDAVYEKIKSAVVNAGEMMLAADDALKAGDVSEKDGDLTNLVTKYDVEIQRYLIDTVSDILPSAVFVAEEKDNDVSVLDSEYCFIIDPIDGTTNFIHGYRHSCISLAMLSRGEVIFAIVYDPYLGEMFSAELGRGAYLNGKRLHVSERPLKNAIVAFGTATYRKDELGERTFDLSREIFYRSLDLRRCGSAALDLSYLAAGRNDAFYELSLYPWDIAAGMLLVREAGGIITTASGKPIDLAKRDSVIASNQGCYDELLEISKKYDLCK